MRNLFASFAIVLCFLPAYGVEEIFGGPFHTPVTVDEQPPFPLTVVDVISGQTWQITTREISYKKEAAIFGEAIGRIKVQLDRQGFGVDSIRTISTWIHYDGQMAYEALLALASVHSVTVFLARPSVANSDWSKNYGTLDVKIMVDSNKPVYLWDILSSYKKQQEREFGRYYGIGGAIRKTARRLVGRDVKICASLFEN